MDELTVEKMIQDLRKADSDIYAILDNLESKYNGFFVECVDLDYISDSTGRRCVTQVRTKISFQ